MIDRLEKQLDEYFDKPVDGKKLIHQLIISKEGVREVDCKPEPALVEVATGFGSVWLNDEVFFNAIKNFAGAKEVRWGPALERDNRTDGEIHKYIVIDSNLYEFMGNSYDKRTGKDFVKRLIGKTINPVKL